MPDNWVEFWDYPNKKYSPPLIYNGKFDIDIIALKIACAKKGIAISVASSNFDDNCCYQFTYNQQITKVAFIILKFPNRLIREAIPVIPLH